MEVKLYCLTNMYCQGVQAGIQAFHAGIKLVKDYEGSVFSTLIDEWYNEHETIVILNAGNQDKLTTHYENLSKQGKVPFAKFNEPGLNDTLTSVAVLCTEEMIDDMALMRTNDPMTDLQLCHKYGHMYETLKAMSTMRTI